MIPSRAEPALTRSDPVEGKVCPDCAEAILQNARKCRYCGYDFGRTSSVDPTGKRERAGMTGWLILIAAFVFGLWSMSREDQSTNDVAPQESTAATKPNFAAYRADAPNDPSSAAEPLGEISSSPEVSELLRRGDGRACAAPQVLGMISELILGRNGAIEKNEGAAASEGQFQVSVAEIAQTAVDRDTAQIGCAANAHVVTPIGSSTFPITYVLRPSLEPQYDFLVSGEWTAAKELVSDARGFGQILSAQQRPPSQPASR